MEKLILGAFIVLLLLLIYWYYSREVIVVTERFNPRYDRSFSQSITDKESDKMKDQAGYTVDDYLLADLLSKRHN